MANSTTNLELIDVNQSQKEVTANALFDAASPAMLFGRHGEACIALTWAWYGGKKSNGSSILSIPNGSVLLSASTTNYIECDNDGVVYKVTGTPTSGRLLLYTVITSTDSVTSYSDWRNGTQGVDFTLSGVTPNASQINITDTGAYYTSTEVEGALQELGEKINPKVTSQAFSSTLNLNADDYQNNEVVQLTLTNDITINLIASSNTQNGFKLLFKFIQNATGGHTVTLNTGFSFGTDITTYVGESAPNLTDYVGVIYNGANNTFDVIATVKGY